MDSVLHLINVVWGFIAAHEILRSLFAALCALIFMLTVVLVVIWMERKVSADIQNRIGPIRTGGPLVFLLQSLADALKLLLKEDLKPRGADRWPFYVAPYLVFLPAFMAYLILPFSSTWIPQDVKVGILFYSAISAVPVLGIAMAGWASNNKWSLLGGLRSAAQLISYEIPLALAIMAVVILHGSLKMSDIVAGQWHQWWMVIITIPSLLIFLVAGMAEVSRTPFDLPEAESELVAGFNTEYSGMRFATFFLAEFSASFLISALAVTLFLGGWSLWGIDTAIAGKLGWHFTDMASFISFAKDHLWAGLAMKAFWFVVFVVKCFMVLWVLMWIKWTMPRLRIDQVLNFGWKVLLPIGLVNLLFVSVVGLALHMPKGELINLPALNAVVEHTNTAPAAVTTPQPVEISIPVPSEAPSPASTDPRGELQKLEPGIAAPQVVVPNHVEEPATAPAPAEGEAATTP